MIRWPDLSRYGAEAVIFHGRHAVRVERPDDSVSAALGGELHGNGLIVLPVGTRLNSRVLSAAFPEFSANDVKEISSLNDVDDSGRPYVVSMPFGANFMAGIPSFKAARSMAESLPAQAIVRIVIKRGSGPHHDSAVHTLHGAFVSNGDSSAVFVHKAFPESRDRPSDDEILRLADEERARWASVPGAKEVLGEKAEARADIDVRTDGSADDPAEHSAKKKNDRRIDDVGAKIGGARKDYSKNAMRYEDAVGMTDAEREKLITVRNVWPFNIREALDGGMQPGVVRYILDARRGLKSYAAFRKLFPWMGKDEEKDVYRWYIGLAGALRDCMAAVKTKADLGQAIADFHKSPDVMAAQKESNNCAKDYFLGANARNRLANTVTRQVDYQGRCFGEYVDDPRDWNKKHDFFNNPKNLDYAISRLLPTRPVPVKTDDIEKRFARPHLDNLVDDFLDGVDHDPQELIDRFGFKGIEFGNWMPQSERQRVVNHAVSSFAFLANIMGIPEDKISLGGELSLAFGARGTGGKRAPMAHYEPSRHVMNLTRLSGAGSLAHEYGHALDNFIGNNGGWNGYATDKSWHEVVEAAKFEFGTDRAIDEFAWWSRRLSDRHSEWAKNWAEGILVKAPNPSSLIRKAQPSPQELIDDIVINALRNQVPDLTIEHIDAAKAARNKADGRGQLVTFLLDELKESGFAPNDAVSNPRGVVEIAVSRFANCNVKLRDFNSCSDRSDHWQVQANLREAVDSAINVIRAMSPGIRENMKRAGLCKTETRFLSDAKKIDESRSKAYWSTNIELFARAFEQFVFYEAADRGKKVDYLVHSVESPKSDETSAYPCERDRLALRESFRKHLLPKFHKALGIESDADSPYPAM